jgi:hypothetical protein
MNRTLQIRVGVEGGRRPVLARALAIGAPLLVSANSLWNNDAKRFSGFQCYAPHDVALDCGGFVAMKLYGGYRWTVQQYAELAQVMRPTWWAQMDLCCEPEIAGDRASVFGRIDKTAEYLHACQDAARNLGTARPMPVLQGWNPSDYCEGPIYSSGFDWPALVGIGSVCRRRVAGNDGILAVLAALDRKVPAHVQFHLFGVKSQVLQRLQESFSHRVTSVDSMAWSFTARVTARNNGTPCNGELRAATMADWYTKQITPPPQGVFQF